jgi:hypothetical protein
MSAMRINKHTGSLNQATLKTKIMTMLDKELMHVVFQSRTPIAFGEIMVKEARKARFV